MNVSHGLYLCRLFSYCLPYCTTRFTYAIQKSNCIVSAAQNGFFYWISYCKKNHGNEGNFLMTQLNAASQCMNSHVAVRAESKQTRKHWSSLTTSDPGWFIPKKPQRGVWVVCMCICVCGYMGMWVYVLLCASLVFCVWVGILCCQWSRLNLGICEISLKGQNIPRQWQLLPFGYNNLCSLPNKLRHFTQFPFWKQSKPAFRNSSF